MTCDIYANSLFCLLITQGNENKNKRRPQNWGDVADLGDGYDLEDTFIDNTEAVSEL